MPLVRTHLCRIVYVITIVAGICTVGSAAVLHVPAEYATIQAAIDAAETGDEVVLANGTYTGAGNINVDFLGKAITLRSAGGDPTLCIIDCQEMARAIYVHDSAGPVLLKGLSMLNGRPPGNSGGGVLCLSSDLRVENCRFIGNGVDLMDRMTLVGVDGSGLPDTADGGGAIYVQDGSLAVNECHFEGCFVHCYGLSDYSGGGGICVVGGSASVTDCYFSNCDANVSCWFGGGAIAAFETTIAVHECEMVACGAHGDGGGFWGQTCTVDIRGNRIRQCSGFHNSGAIGLGSCSGTIANNVLCDNSAGEGGGAMLITYGSLSVTGCTIANNDGGYGSGGGLLTYYITQVDVKNCIIWGNTATSGPQIDWYGTSAPVVSYCDVQGGWTGTGNINQGPYLTTDYHLSSSSSPCINAGDPAYVLAAGDADIDGQIRKWPRTGRVDMGADEYGSFGYGDLNCDHNITAFDIDPFVRALTNPTVYAATWPNCWYLLADLNADGAVNAFDIDPFVLVLTGG
jgi:hypothetical protein